MPKAFDACVNAGGRVRTVSGPSKQFGLVKGQYRRICFIKGESHLGHVKTKDVKDKK